jgi:hypothetical protein
MSKMRFSGRYVLRLLMQKTASALLCATKGAIFVVQLSGGCDSWNFGDQRNPWLRTRILSRKTFFHVHTEKI